MGEGGGDFPTGKKVGPFLAKFLNKKARGGNKRDPTDPPVISFIGTFSSGGEKEGRVIAYFFI